MTSWKLGLFGFFSLLLAACGNVVVPGDPSGTGGSGGSSSSSGDGGSGASTPTTTTSSASGNPATVCQNICGKLAALGCPDADDCAAECPGLIAEIGECADELVAFLDCYAATITNCEQEPVQCAPQLEAYEECGDEPPSACSEAICAVGQDGTNQLCDCTKECEFATFEASCVTPGGAPTECVCKVDGQVVGTCSQDSVTCSFEGCCDEIFGLL